MHQRKIIYGNTKQNKTIAFEPKCGCVIHILFSVFDFLYYLDCGCSRDFNPVCDTNGNTWENESIARCHKVMVVHEGECHRPTPERPGTATLSHSSSIHKIQYTWNAHVYDKYNCQISNKYTCRTTRAYSGTLTDTPKKVNIWQ